MAQALERVNGIVWGAPALVMILGVGLWLSLRTGFAQIRLFPAAVRCFVKQFRQKGRDGISPMQALCTALAATVGTGNLAGVAGAIAIGGPGAVFWMWVCALLGMMLKFAEAALSVEFRAEERGEAVGGPMYTVRNALKKRWHWLGSVYAFFGVVAAFGVGNATQINAVITGLDQALETFGVSVSAGGNLLIGLALAILVGIMLCGGARRIGAVAEKLVPFAAAAYLLLGLTVLIARFQAIPAALAAIFRGAFAPKAVTGGMIGSALITLRVGISRGVFTNEAGMGTAGIAHAGAQGVHPVRQGLLGIIEVFLDTVVICTVTALVILVSGVSVPYGTDPGVSLTSAAFAMVCGEWVTVLIAATLVLFAFATVLGWGLYGNRCARYLFGPGAQKPFTALQIGTVVLGAVLKTGTVWLLSETVNGLMAIPNLIILAKLTPELLRLIKEYGTGGVDGGIYENFNQCQSLRTVPYAEIPSAGGGGAEKRKKDLSSEYRSAGFGHTSGLL